MQFQMFHQTHQMILGVHMNRCALVEKKHAQPVSELSSSCKSVSNHLFLMRIFNTCQEKLNIAKSYSLGTGGKVGLMMLIN